LEVHDEINNIKMGAYILKIGYDRYKKRGLDDQTSWLRSLVDYSGGSLELAKKEMLYYKEGTLLSVEKTIEL